MYKRIIVEGLPCAGKTTICKRLIAENEQYYLVPEIAESLHPGETFPGNAASLLEAKCINDWFVEKESRRMAIAERLVQQRNVLLDRSFPSHLTYCYAYSILKGMNILGQTYDAYAAALQSGTLQFPDLFVYLRINPETMLKRLETRVYKDKRVMLPNFWRGVEYLSDLMDAYDVFFRQLGEQVATFVLDGTPPSEQVFRQFVRGVGGAVTRKEYISRGTALRSVRAQLEQKMR